ncbi:MAG TPA: CopD family protein [Solirubrobacteraceae bacterium]|nr:CopD family protein [Solirubrobacteraceae bacterium]
MVIARRLVPVVVLACLLLITGTPAAFAHAQLLGTSPQSGSTVAVQPAQVIFKFNQAVGGTLGAVRVYNAQGDEVDNLAVSHPGGHEQWMGVGLKPKLADGTYTATYRVISADTHIVYGGLVFNIGHAGAAPRFTVAGLIDRNKAGEVTTVAFGAVRFLDYLSLALGIGGLAFLVFVWAPVLSGGRDENGAEKNEDGNGNDLGRHGALRAFACRMRTLLLLAVALGVIASLLGILLQGADAAGVSLWSSLKGAILENTLDSRFGWVWASRGIVWLLLGALLIASRRRSPSKSLLTAAVAGAIYLAMTPALSGHASVQGPTLVFFPADLIHVLAASVWVGGIACLLLALPAATRQLEGPERTRLLLAALARFSPLALGCVLALALTGVVQAYIDVRTVEALFDTTYGVLVLVKTGLLIALIAFGWVNRRRVIPALERIAHAAGTPGGVGVLARRNLRGEIVLMLAVFGVTAALVAYAPPIDAASGPFSANATLGPAELELTVEPARVGLNTIHLYLIDAKTGSQFTATKELTVSARLPSKGIGPLPLRSNLAGPGHYIFSSAELSPGGTWELEILDRVSEFQEYSQTVRVPIH